LEWHVPGDVLKRTRMSREKEIEPGWVGWLRQQVAYGADFGEVKAFLNKGGISDQAISAVLEVIRPLDSALARGKLELPPLIRRAPPQLKKLDVTGLDLYTYEDFMSAKECQRVTALAAHNLRPSPLSYDIGDELFRNSQTCLLAHLRSPVALAIDAKICKAMGIRAEYGEAIQAQRYDVGEQFKPHWDFFTPSGTDYQRFAGVRGNRTWTFMVYLNDGMEGGDTRFTEIGYAVTPKAGMALLWSNLHPDGSPNLATKHCGEPVTRGHKVIITKWFRVLGNGPVFSE
jgi:prolyl 4-hydroxylase